MLARAISGWFHAALPMAVLLVALTPVATFGAPDWFLPLWLLLPVYLAHQAEEYNGDAFRHYLNGVVFGGREGLTRGASFIINVGVVWFGFAGTFAAALFWHPAIGLIGVYTILINALVHILGAIRFRGVNPGLYTAAMVFPVFGVWALLALWPLAAPIDHLIGAGVALAGHATIMASVFTRLRHIPPVKTGKSA